MSCRIKFFGHYLLLNFVQQNQLWLCMTLAAEEAAVSWAWLLGIQWPTPEAAAALGSDDNIKGSLFAGKVAYCDAVRAVSNAPSDQQMACAVFLWQQAGEWGKRDSRRLLSRFPLPCLLPTFGCLRLQASSLPHHSSNTSMYFCP